MVCNDAQKIVECYFVTLKIVKGLENRNYGVHCFFQVCDEGSLISLYKEGGKIYQNIPRKISKGQRR